MVYIQDAEGGIEMETTAQRLRQIMSERNLRQVDILNLCKPYCEKYHVTLNKSHLSQYVAGKFAPMQDKLTILAMALGVSEAWLMGYVADEESHAPFIVRDKTSLSREEEKMVLDYRLLNREGQEKVLSYISDLTDMSKYKKHGVDDVVEGA